MYSPSSLWPPSFHTHSPQELVIGHRDPDTDELKIRTLLNLSRETKAKVGRIGAVTDPLIVNSQPSSVLPLSRLLQKSQR
jgi:hypothetical protein